MGDLFLGKTNSLRHGWRGFFFYVAATAGYAFLRSLIPVHSRPGQAMVLFAVLVFVSWLFLALENRPLHSIGLRLGPRWAREFGLGLLGGIGVIAVSAAIAFAAGGFRLGRDPSGGVWAMGAGALFFLAPALNEELAFRGYIFQRFEKGMGPWASLALMSALFAFAHQGNPGMAGMTRTLASLNIFLAGVLLGLAYLATRSLALPMGIHLGWNWAQGALFGFGVSGTTSKGFFTPVFLGRPLWLTGGEFGLEASLPCTVVCVLGCVLLGRMWFQRKRSPAGVREGLP